MSFLNDILTLYKSKNVQTKVKIKKPEYIRSSNIEQCAEIQKNLEDINKMYNSDFYKMISCEIKNILKNGATRCGVMPLDAELNERCSHKFKPVADTNYLPIYDVSINNERIMICGELLYFDKLGYRDLTDKQAEILGMTLVVYGHYEARYLEKFDEYYFLNVHADEEYWLPIIQDRINQIYNEKVEEYNRTHKSIL